MSQLIKQAIRKFGYAVFAFLYTVSASVLADDTDIYLNNSAQSYPPFLMLMIDYRPSTFNNLCGSVAACAGEALDADKDGFQDYDDGYPLFKPGTLSTLAINKLMRKRCEAIAGGCGDRATGDGSYSDSVSTFEAFIAVLAAVVDDTSYDGLYVGLMAPNKDDGGSILRGYKQNGADIGGGVLGKEELINVLSSIPEASTGGDAHKLQPKETYYELYSYLNGLNVPLGSPDQTVTNFGGTEGKGNSPDSPVDPRPDTSVMVADSSSSSGYKYVSPFEGRSSDFECSKLFGIAMAMSVANQDDALDDEIDAIDGDKAGAVGASDDFEDFLKYMASDDADLVDDSLLAEKQGMVNWIVSDSGSKGHTPAWAAAGGTGDGVIYLDEGVQMEAKLRELFTEVLSVSTTFVAASVPVNVFNRTEILDSFYIALFQAEATERWPGNLKKLKLKDTTADGRFDEIVDVNDDIAFDPTTGRIQVDRLTYWTDDTELPTPNAADGEVEGKDGRSVKRGGAGQIIPGFIAGAMSLTNGSGTRQLFTEVKDPANDDNTDGLLPLNADASTAAILQTDLNAADVDTAQQLLMWARGINVDLNDPLDTSLTAPRDWIMGDAIHSRPIAINYGARGSYTETYPDVRLYMGANDGYLRQIKNINSGGSESGAEAWAYMPRELLSNISGLATDDGSFDAPNSDGVHPYGMDGEVVTLVIDNDNDGTIETGDKVYIYTGMRRGGRSYYALDVSDPDAPEILWKIDNTTTGFSSLGLTFSTPVVTKVRYDGTDKNVLIFAGGYDTKKDDTDADGGRDPDSMGNAIYIVDAVTGDLIWSAVDGTGTATDEVFYNSDLDHSIPAKVAPLDSNNNGVTDRLYVGDTSGVVWRVDLPEGSAANHRRDNWEITKFADVGGDPAEEDRRFFHQAELVQTSDGFGGNPNYDGVLLASGDRASPLERVDENMLFLFKDRNIASGTPPTGILGDDQLADVTGCVTGTEAGCTTTLSQTNLQYGWKINLREGEKGLSKPLLAAGNVFFTTYSEITYEEDDNEISSCGPTEGSGYLYYVSLSNGTTALTNNDGTLRDTRTENIGSGIPAPVVALTGDTVLVPGKGADLDGNEENEKLVDTGGKGHWIYYWRQKGQDQL